jgi:hypothetical protein
MHRRTLSQVSALFAPAATLPVLSLLVVLPALRTQQPGTPLEAIKNVFFDCSFK